MLNDINALLTTTYMASTVRPLATYTVGTITYIIYPIKSLEGIGNVYPVLRTYEFTTGQTRFDDAGLITNLDVKAGGAPLLAALAAIF